jgi:hypothetical protein
VPAFYLQIFAGAIALSYFYWPAALPSFEYIATLKTEYGIVFAILSTALFGGLLPYLMMLLRGQIHFAPFAQVIFYGLLWGFIGGLVDTFYGLQSFMFGDSNELSTIAKKVIVDQFVFSVFVTAPIVTLSFLFRDCRFSIRHWKRSINSKIFTQQIPITVVSTWIVWIPAVSIIYSMPSALQIPLNNIVLCMFVLILAIVNKPETNN